MSASYIASAVREIRDECGFMSHPPALAAWLRVPATRRRLLHELPSEWSDVEELQEWMDIHGVFGAEFQAKAAAFVSSSVGTAERFSSPSDAVALYTMALMAVAFDVRRLADVVEAAEGLVETDVAPLCRGRPKTDGELVMLLAYGRCARMKGVHFNRNTPFLKSNITYTAASWLRAVEETGEATDVIGEELYSPAADVVAEDLYSKGVIRNRFNWVAARMALDYTCKVQDVRSFVRTRFPMQPTLDAYGMRKVFVEEEIPEVAPVTGTDAHAPESARRSAERCDVDSVEGRSIRAHVAHDSVSTSEKKQALRDLRTAWGRVARAVVEDFDLVIAVIDAASFCGV
jgi:hypothetical protein